VSTESLRLEWRSPAELAENPRNWRRHPQAQIAALTDVLTEVGWAGACLFNERTGRLIDGHARRKVALEQGTARVPVLVGDWSEADEAKILATLDPIGALALADKAQLDSLLRDVQTGSQAVADMLTDLAEKANVLTGLPNATEGEVLEVDEDADEDGLDLLFKAPFPWFGGKSRVAKMVWKRFGDVSTYLEPFFGSGAVFLNRPLPFDGNETVNDFDGLVANFWRALQADPAAVAKYADWPVNENDLTARHAWLVARKDTLQAKLEGDPDYFDAKIAGWWCWGMACWIGSGFCSGNGPWQVVEAEDGSRQLVHLGDDGQGVNRQLVHLSDEGRGVNRQLVHLSDEGRGVNRQLVHLSTDGQGVNRQRVHLGNEGRGVNRKRVHLGGEWSDGRGVVASNNRLNEGDKAGMGECGLLAWMQALSERLKRVRVCCGDWTRICGGRDGDAISHFFSAGDTCGIFLDPPYSDAADRDPDIYRVESLSVANAVREWAIRHGDDSRLRIALCGYEGEHQMPASWSCVSWKAAGGMAALSADLEGKGKLNSRRERVWFSPHCLKPQ
jgi:hypothetical protein